MTEQKKIASADSLTEAGKTAKIELNERQLNDVAGGLTFNGTPAEAAKKLDFSPIQAPSMNLASKI